MQLQWVCIILKVKLVDKREITVSLFFADLKALYFLKWNLITTTLLITLVIDLKTEVEKKSTPLEIKDLEIRKAIYKNNSAILNKFPGDVNVEESKKNFHLYESQIEYIKDLTIGKLSSQGR